MKTIKNVLLATDFSKASEAAQDWAVEVAKANDAHLYLLHVLYLPSPMTPYVATPPDLTRELQQAADARLGQLVEDLDGAGLETTSLLTPGLPSKVIKEVATDRECDLIVMGTQGLTGLKHLLLGSTAERVIQHAPCPVLAVHPQDLGRQRPLVRILVPTDFSPESEGAANQALELLHPRQEQCTLVLTNAYQLPFEYTAYGAVPTTWDYLKDVAGVAREEADKKAEELRKQGWKVEVVVEEGTPDFVITERAKATNVDLIVMGTHGRSGLGHLLLGSTTERVLQYAECPVLVVQRPS